MEAHPTLEYQDLDMWRFLGSLQWWSCGGPPYPTIPRFRHVEAPGQPSVVELWRPTLPYNTKYMKAPGQPSVVELWRLTLPYNTKYVEAPPAAFSGGAVEAHPTLEYQDLDMWRFLGSLQWWSCGGPPYPTIPIFRHVEVPGQPSVVELWRHTLP